MFILSCTSVNDDLFNYVMSCTRNLLSTIIANVFFRSSNLFLETQWIKTDWFELVLRNYYHRSLPLTRIMHLTKQKLDKIFTLDSLSRAKRFCTQYWHTHTVINIMETLRKPSSNGWSFFVIAYFQKYEKFLRKKEKKKKVDRHEEYLIWRRGSPRARLRDLSFRFRWGSFCCVLRGKSVAPSAVGSAIGTYKRTEKIIRQLMPSSVSIDKWSSIVADIKQWKKTRGRSEKRFQTKCYFENGIQIQFS